MALFTRLRRIAGRTAPLERRLDEDIESCLAMLAEQHIRDGMNPEDADRAARQTVGNIARIKDQVRQGRSEYMFDAIVQDVRYAARGLRKNRGFALTAIVALGIGIAAITSVFGLMNTMLWQPPRGLRDPSTLIALYLDEKATPEIDYRGLSYPQYDALRQQQDVFSDLVFYLRFPGIWSLDSEQEAMNTEAVTGNYFPVFGVSPVIGRPIGTDDDKAGAPPVAMISYQMWQSRFNGQPDVLGRTLLLGGTQFTVVGVAPRDYFGTHFDWYEFPKIWIPLSSLRSAGRGGIYTTRGAFMPVVGRLKPGVELAAAQARMNSIVSAVYSPGEKYRPDSIPLVPISQTRVGPNRRQPLIDLFAVVLSVSVLILLAACFNVANFLLGHAATRRHEMAIRLALGASRVRIVRQLLTESLLLAAGAGAVGLGLVALLDTLVGEMPKLFTRIALYTEPVWDVHILGLTFALCVLATLIFGLIPALVASSRTTWEVLKESSSGWSWSRLKPTPRQLLLTIQVTVAVVLAVSGLLFARSLYKMARQDAGFPTHDILVARIDPPSMTPAEGGTYYRTLISSLLATPGIHSASLSNGAPLSGLVGQLALSVPGRSGDYGMVWTNRVSPGYFANLGITLAAGREYQDTPEDRAQAILMNETLARKLWPGESAIGKVIHVQNSADNSDRQVIGIVAQSNCEDRLLGPGTCLYPAFPMDGQAEVIEIRTDSFGLAATALRDITHKLNPRTYISDIRPLESDYHNQIAGPRTAAITTGVLALLGVLLSAIGCFAVFSSMVQESTREIALRMALGASERNLLAQIVFRALVLGLIGVAAGLGIAGFIARYAKDQFYATSPHDFFSMAVASAAVILIAGLASYLPARAATRIDPSTALKNL